MAWEAPLTPRDMTPRAAESTSVARNATWNQGDRTASPASLGESRLGCVSLGNARDPSEPCFMGSAEEQHRLGTHLH